LVVCMCCCFFSKNEHTQKCKREGHPALKVTKKG
jgi:hypothetical protein